MRVVNTVQNSKEWLAWRGKGIGASDVASILGTSKWTTAFEMWTYLTGTCTRPEANPFAAAAMKRGQDLEPRAREIANRQLGKVFEPICVELENSPFIRASLDGFCGKQENGFLVTEGEILEIKCPGKEAHGKALKGIIPAEYYAQMQQQFLVSGASKGYYFSWDGKSADGVVIETYPDIKFMAMLQERLIAFWSQVQMLIPPAVTKADVEKLTDRLTKEQGRVTNTLRALQIAASALEEK